jgi:hypothetical protein
VPGFATNTAPHLISGCLSCPDPDIFPCDHSTSVPASAA